MPPRRRPPDWRFPHRDLMGLWVAGRLGTAGLRNRGPRGVCTRGPAAEAAEVLQRTGAEVLLGEAPHRPRPNLLQQRPEVRNAHGLHLAVRGNRRVCRPRHCPRRCGGTGGGRGRCLRWATGWATGRPRAVLLVLALGVVRVVRVLAVVAVPARMAVPPLVSAELAGLVLAAHGAGCLPLEALPDLQALADALGVVALVVVVALGLVPQELEGLSNHLEPVPGLLHVHVGVPALLPVGVHLHRLPAVGALDVDLGGVPGDAQDGVVVRAVDAPDLELRPLHLPEGILVLLPGVELLEHADRLVPSLELLQDPGLANRRSCQPVVQAGGGPAVCQAALQVSQLQARLAARHVAPRSEPGGHGTVLAGLLA
mmetsp:Transcript_47233/g.148363  ORF Transcript_47233/g.148363 Transcript_47233/m.148363 type:complete len:369 (-) Transcript_47233:847-1953(-)